MIFSPRSKNIFSAVSALVCLGLYTGEQPHHTGGLSPYHVAAAQWEDRVFQQNQIIADGLNSAVEEGIKGQIIQVIANYNTGLKPAHLKNIPALIMRESKKYGHDPLLLTALIVTESSFYNWARSRRGALGLMQIRPKTGAALAEETQLEWKGKPTLFDPGFNITLGAYYLDKLMKRFGHLDLALEAYNHGPTRLDRYLKKGYRPNVYSRRVIDRYEMIRSQQI